MCYRWVCSCTVLSHEKPQTLRICHRFLHASALRNGLQSRGWVWVVVAFLNVLPFGLPLNSTRSLKAPNPGHMLLLLHARALRHGLQSLGWVWVVVAFLNVLPLGLQLHSTQS